MTDPKLTDTAREEFKAALLHSADQLLDSPQAAAVLARFLTGDAALMLTSSTMFVMPVDAAAKALRDATEQAVDTPSYDDGPSTGVYL